MTFRDPIAAYNAASNIDAHMASGNLQEAGIPALAVEDNSLAGAWMGGVVAEIHKPQVWIKRADAERARPILADFDRRIAERYAAERGERSAGPPIEVACERCGKPTRFPAAQKGTVQNCPHCRAFVDVGDEPDIAGWDEAPGEDEVA